MSDMKAANSRKGAAAGGESSEHDGETIDAQSVDKLQHRAEKAVSEE